MVYHLKTYLIIPFIIVHLFGYAQQNDSIQLKYLIATGSGYDHNLWCGPEEVYLELEDSTLIRFDVFRTFERGLKLKDQNLIFDREYRVLLMKDNETIQVRKFNTDSIWTDPNLVVDFDPRRCCYLGEFKHVFFKTDSSNILNTYCSDRNSLIDFALNRDSQIEIVGINNDSITTELTEERILQVKRMLVANGVSKTKISIRKEYANANDFGNSSLLGAEYLVYYYIPNREIGVILKRLD